MKQFDMTRFSRVLKLDFFEGRKAMMWGALCMVLLYLFFFWFAHNIGIHDSRYDYIQAPERRMLMRVDAICEAVGVFSAIAMFIFFLISASTLYRGEQKKQQRIAWLMLPASNLEKFLSRWIYLLVFSLVGGLLSFFVADLIHMAYLTMTDYPVQSAADDFFKFFPHTRTFPSGEYTGDSPLSVTSEYTALIAIHAFFLLGGVFFKKFHFIATSAVLVILFASSRSSTSLLPLPCLSSCLPASSQQSICWGTVTDQFHLMKLRNNLSSGLSLIPASSPSSPGWPTGCSAAGRL